MYEKTVYQNMKENSVNNKHQKL